MLDSFQTQKASLTKTLNPFIASKHIHILVTHLNIWRASEASDTLSGVYKFELAQYRRME